MKRGNKSKTKATQKSLKEIYKHFRLNLVVAVSKGPDHLKLVPEILQAQDLDLTFEKTNEIFCQWCDIVLFLCCLI